MELQQEGSDERWRERRLSSAQAVLVWAVLALLGWSMTVALLWLRAQLF